MVKPNKIWEATKKNLCQAINKLTDETTEIVIVPFAFDSNFHNFLEGKSAFANEEGKKQLCSYINNLPQPNPNTKTFHSDALGDFYKYRVKEDKITYLFLMTDGESEDNGKFEDMLKQWGEYYGEKEVYGFYVMLNKTAHNNAVLKIIKNSPHIWQVDDADVSVNPIRLQNKAVFNARNDKYFDLNIYGSVEGVDFFAAFEEGMPYKISKVEKMTERLRIYVDFDEDIYSLPISQDHNVSIVIKGGSDYDFLITENVTVKCESIPEKSLKVSIK